MLCVKLTNQCHARLSRAGPRDWGVEYSRKATGLERCWQGAGTVS